MPRSKKRARSASTTEQAAPEKADPETSSGPRPFWSGTLSFGLVSIPVELVRATRPSGIALRMLAADGTPLARRFVCPEDGKEIPNSDLVRGYEHRPGEYIAITDEELEALEPEKSRDIDLRRFVPEASIDPIYFDRPFFLMPSGTSSKAYRLLALVMEREHRAGIATFVMHDREHVVAIVARDGLLRAELLRFAAELRTADDVGLPSKPKLSKGAVSAFSKVIEKHAQRSIDLAQLEDEMLKRTHALLEEKRKHGRDVIQNAETASYEPAQAEIIDLMEILKKSLQKDAGRSGTRRAHSS